MPTLQDLEYQHSVSKNAVAMSNDERKRAIVKQASDLYISGKPNEAIGLLGQVDPDAIIKLSQEQLKPKNSIIQDENGAYAVDQQYGQQPNVTKLDSVGGKSKAAGYGQTTFQVRDPITGEVQIRNRGTGQLVDIVGSPQTAIQQGVSKPEDLDPGQTYNTLPPTDRKKYQVLQEGYLKDSKDDRAAVQAAYRLQTMLQAGKDLNQDILRAFQNQFARATGEKGVMTEQDVAPFGGRQSALDRLQRFFEYQSTGQIPQEDRSFLDSLAKKVADANEDAVVRRAEPFVKQVQTQTGNKVSETQARNLLLQGIVKPHDGGSDHKKYAPGTQLKIKGKLFQVGPDGDSLTEVQAP